MFRVLKQFSFVQITNRYTSCFCFSLSNDILFLLIWVAYILLSVLTPIDAFRMKSIFKTMYILVRPFHLYFVIV